MPSATLILFSGMGADESIFLAQKRAFPDVVVMKWEVPRSAESFAEYCERIAGLIEVEERVFLGGASFGGIVAQEVARHLDCEACFLIGSVRSPQQLPLRIRIWRPFRGLVQFMPIRLFQLLSKPLQRVSVWFHWKHLAGLLRQFSNADAVVLKWSIKQILCWNGSSISIPVFHIHGSRDFILPAKHLEADIFIPNAGHVISLTHGSIVNDFLRQHMQEPSCEEPTDSSSDTEN